MSRHEAKGAFFHYLYSWQENKGVRRMRVHADAAKQRKRLVRDAIAQIMATHFPTLSNFILQTKQMVGHKEFSHQMQRLESRLLIDGVCGQLMASARPRLH